MNEAGSVSSFAKPRLHSIDLVELLLLWGAPLFGLVVTVVGFCVTRDDGTSLLPAFDADSSHTAFATFASLASLAVAATAIIIAGSPRHKEVLERAKAWRRLLHAMVFGILGWAVAAAMAFVIWIASWQGASPLLWGLAVVAAVWGGRATLWVAAAVLRFK